MITDALRQTGGNVSAAARLLGTGRTTIRRYAQNYTGVRRALDRQRERARQAARADQGEEQAPPVTGRRLESLSWAGADWPWMEIRRGVDDKHFGRLGPGDVCQVPPRQAQAWLASGTAVPVPEDGGEG
jgi:hypothetical protein